MARISTPYAYSHELLQVRDQIFSLGQFKDKDERQDAVNTMAMWRMRQTMAHYIESTWMILEASLLLGMRPSVSDANIRSALANALSRYVA